MNYNSRVAQKGNKKMLGPKLENLLRMSNTEAVKKARPKIIEEARPGILAEGAEKNDAMIQELVRKLEEVGRSNEISRAILDLTYRRQLLTEFFPEREI